MPKERKSPGSHTGGSQERGPQEPAAPQAEGPDVTSPQWEVTAQPVTVDDFAAHPDFNAVEHMLVPSPPDVVYASVRHLDLMTIESRWADAAMWLRGRLRGLPERLRRRTPEVPDRLTLDDLAANGEWVLLGEQPGREVVLGAAGQFWTPVVRWERLPAEQFTEYGKPGRGKIILSLSVRPYSRQGSLLTYDVRVALADGLSRKLFGLYWRMIKPMVKQIMRATLRAAARDARLATAD